MPIGSYAAVPLIAQALLERRPHTVLDLGMGFGGGGVIVREWLDSGVKPWNTHLTGVEVWADYRNPVWDLYNAIYTQTIEEFVASSDATFDFVLLCEVLEHFEGEQGRKIIAEVKRRVAVRGCLVVTTPAVFFRQPAVYGNEHERHRSAWTAETLTELDFAVERAGRPDYFCGECLFATWRNESSR
jgi:Methyltransferase domain